MITRATNNKGGHITSGFAKVRQSELVFEYFSEIVYCRTCRKAAGRYMPPSRNIVEKSLVDNREIKILKNNKFDKNEL